MRILYVIGVVRLRTPLQHVKGYIDLLAEGAMGNLTSKQTEGLTLAQEAVARLEKVVYDIVDFSTLDESALSFEPIYLLDVCRSVINGYTAMANRRKVSITLSDGQRPAAGERRPGGRDARAAALAG